MALDGIDATNYITPYAPPGHPGSALTLLAWVYLDTAVGGAAKQVVSWQIAGADYFRGFHLVFENDERAFCYGLPSSGFPAQPRSQLDVDLTLNAWHLIAAVVDDGAVNKVTLYTGTPTATATEPAQTHTNGAFGFSLTGDLGVGTDNGQNEPFDCGRLAMTGVWSVALTLAEIQQQQFSRVPVRPSDCVLFTDYGLVGGATGLQPDLSGNARNGSITGTPTKAPHVPLMRRVPRMVFPMPAAVPARRVFIIS